MCSRTFLYKPIRADANPAGQIRNNRGEAALSKTHPATGERSVNNIKLYVDSSESESKTCFIHVLGHFYDECEILGGFGDKYAKGKPKKDCRNHPVP